MTVAPELTLEIDLESFGTKAFLVIDRLVGHTSWGGLRIVPDSTKEEVIASARTMTHKHGFVGWPMGGAKAALDFREELQPARREILLELGRRLSRYLRTDEWIPGVDMGCTLEDIRNLYRGAGVKKDLSSWKDLSPLYTAWSVYLATRAGLAARGASVEGKAYVVQGLGRVGVSYCQLMSEAGARLIAVSTRKGAIYNPSGLDADDIVQCRMDEGDGFVLRPGRWESIESENLLELEVDIVVPCARCWAIHDQNYARIRGDIIPCAANVAMEPRIEQMLFEKGKIVITDFVANCGGVFGSVLERYLDPTAIHRLLEANYSRKVTRLLHQSAEQGRSVGEIATDEAMARINDLGSLSERAFYDVGRRMLPFIPSALREPALLRYCSMRFFTD